MARPKFTIVNLFLATAVVAIAVAWRATTLLNESDEQFVVNVCFIEANKQIVSTSTRLDQTFEITYWSPTTPEFPPIHDNKMRGLLYRHQGQLHFSVRANLKRYRIGGFQDCAYFDKSAELNTPIPLPNNGKPGAVAVIQRMGYRLNDDLTEDTVAMAQRKKLVQAILNEYLSDFGPSDAAQRQLTDEGLAD